MIREKNEAVENRVEAILGIDTSNYKTSVALTDVSGNILADIREFLKVRQGERGLRQSDALFQHVEKLPELVKQAFGKAGSVNLRAISASNRPRPIEGSYMPVFKAGVGTARSIGAACGVPVYEFSHQEGHLEAAAASCGFKNEKQFLAYHLSGGTCELLLASKKENGYHLDIIGGTKDISFGQVLDRVGVFLGHGFPAGAALDRIALAAKEESKVLKKIPLSGLFVNLSGIDTQCRRAVSSSEDEKAEPEVVDAVICELFARIAEALAKLTEEAVKETGIRKVLFSGGVACSESIRKHLNEMLQGKSAEIAFGTPLMSQDNAVGTALLGVRAYGNETGAGFTAQPVY